MTHDELMALLRAAGGVSYTSPARGAVCVARLSYGLPNSEQIAGLSDAQRAHASIQKTIAHPHRHHRWLDQLGDGEWFELERDVTIEGQRWTFKVTLHVDQAGTAAIDDATVARPGDEDEDQDQDEDEAHDHDQPDGHESDLAPAQQAGGTVACPCCGRATLSRRGDFEICPVCFWEDAGQDSDDADVERGGSNRVSLTEGRRNYLAFGASVEADRDHVRPPTDEEVALRHFDVDGREIQPAH